jgi:hypothetical protein
LNEIRNLLIGLELGEETSQLAYYDRRTKNPVSVAVKPGTNLYRFPTVLTRLREEGKWMIGYEAEHFASEGRGSLVKNLLRISSRSGFEVDGTYMEGWELLQVFISGALDMLGVSDPAQLAQGICITVRSLTPNLAAALKRALRKIGFAAEKIFIQDGLESFFYYTYSQRPEIWNRTVGLIEFEKNEVTMHCLMENKKTRPITVKTRKIGHTWIPADVKKKDAAFAAALTKWLEDQTFSGLFITGEGFGDWSKQSLDLMCRDGCHVFAGDNLFVRGACYTALEKTDEPMIRGRVYLGPDMLRASVGLDVIIRDKQQWMPLVSAGENWFDRETCIDFILDGRSDIMMTTVPMDGKGGKPWRLVLDGLPKRPDRTTRIRLKAYCTDADTCVVKAEDLGFGEMFPATHKIWTLKIALGEES